MTFKAYDSDNFYFDDDGHPIVHESYCAIIDLLGFTALTKHSDTHNSLDALLQQIYKALSDGTQHLAGLEQYYKVFSDNLVIVHPRRDEWRDAESEFGRIARSVLDYQMQLASAGFFTRGALAFGHLHFSEKVIFGMPIIDAHETETARSVFPRIVLHRSALDKLHEQIRSYASVLYAPHRHHLLLDSDGEVFLNYLSSLIPDSDVLFEDGLKDHQRHIEAALLEHQGNQHVFEKYIWLAAYHNFFCEQFARLPASRWGIDIEEYLIQHPASSRFRAIDELFTEPR